MTFTIYRLLTNNLPLFLLSFLLFGYLNTAAQIQECYTGPPPVVTLSTIGPNAVCGGVSQDWLDHFYKPEYYHLENSANIALTGNKEIKIKVIVVTNSYYSRPNFTIADTAVLRSIFETWPNDVPQRSLSSLKPTNKPQSNICGDCYISDAKFRIKLTGIDFRNTYEAFPETSDGIAQKTTDGTYLMNQFGSQTDSILNVFVMNYGYQKPDSNTSQGGYAYGGGNLYTLINNAKLCVMAYNYKTTDHWAAAVQFVHELGHHFGLGHLYGQECNDVTDRLVDIFPPGTCDFPGNSINYNTFDASNPNNTHTYNYMDFRPGGYFSPIQISRMHRGAHLGDISSYIYPIDQSYDAPYQVHTDQVWAFGIRLYKDIVVKSGNTLTIKCRVEMPPGSRIIVEKGAKLVIDGGMVTAYHHKTSWRGIELYGDKNAAATPENQGSLIMQHEAMIEYATDGVRDFMQNTLTGGGIIQATNSTFKDCRRAVELNDYPNYNRGSSCSFTGVTFLTMDAGAVMNLGRKDFPVFSAYNEREILIKDCTFKNTIPLSTPFYDMEQRNRAIYSEDAGFRIENSSFKGYKQAINIGDHSNHPLRNVRVKNCSFDSVGTGIVFTDNFSYAQGNTFDHPINYVYTSGMQTYLHEGQAIYADNAGALTLTTNTVLNSGNNPNTRGITVHRSLATGARVIDNNISSARIGIITQNNNPALDILCNHFGGGDYNLVLNPASPNGLLKNQGNGCFPNQYRAGNTFSSGTIKHIASYLNSPNWSYYYWGADPAQVPGNISGTFNDENCNAGEGDPNSQCNLPGNIEQLVYRFKIGDLIEWIGQISPGELSSRQWTEFAAIVHYFNDTGDIAGLTAFLENVDHPEAKKLLPALYIDQQNQPALDAVLSNLAVSTAERTALQTYYGLLYSLRKAGRSIYELDAIELIQVRQIAVDTFDISARARGLLAFAYGEDWQHYQEQLPPMLSSGKAVLNTAAKGTSILYDAAPNPAQSIVRIELDLSPADAVNSRLLIRDMMGKVVQEHKLAAGRQLVELKVHSLQTGVYTYSLMGNGKVIQVKRLVVLQ